MNFILRILLGAVIFFVLSACINQPQNIQAGNLSGKVEDNKWDYYNGTPTHYTSFQRTIHKGKFQTINESTDAFSATYNLDSTKEKGFVTLNKKTVTLNKISALEFEEKSNFPSEYMYSYDSFYGSADNLVFIAVNRFKQIIVLRYFDSDEITDIAYYPSRYLACKKISALQLAKSAEIASQLAKTILVAGIQSYTSYSTYNSYGTIHTQYGNWGYIGRGIRRDYSWAGYRGADALESIFSGNVSMGKLNIAWQSLNCY